MAHSQLDSKNEEISPKITFLCPLSAPPFSTHVLQMEWSRFICEDVLALCSCGSATSHRINTIGPLHPLVHRLKPTTSTTNCLYNNNYYYYHYYYYYFNITTCTPCLTLPYFALPRLPSLTHFKHLFLFTFSRNSIKSNCISYFTLLDIASNFTRILSYIYLHNVSISSINQGFLWRHPNDIQ